VRQEHDPLQTRTIIQPQSAGFLVRRCRIGDNGPLRDHFETSDGGVFPTLTATVLNDFIAETGFVLEPP
jgi:hypothetical protein